MELLRIGVGTSASKSLFIQLAVGIRRFAAQLVFTFLPSAGFGQAGRDGEFCAMNPTEILQARLCILRVFQEQCFSQVSNSLPLTISENAQRVDCPGNKYLILPVQWWRNILFMSVLV